MSAAEETLKLQLGDIIQIESPSNELYNDKVYLITYIDTKQIEIQDITSLKKTSLIINDDGELADESIETISLLSRDEESGYARQNGLLPKTWITITMGGDLPAIFTGEITNLEEDMIEVQTYPEKQTIYIDFGYKGIPKDIPIKSIEIRDPPALDIVDVSVRGEDVAESEPTAQPSAGPSAVAVPEVTRQIKEFIVAADDIVFGDDLGEITQLVAVDEEHERYGIQSQTNDLLDELLATVPNSERTEKVLNNIHLIIERFKELRARFSDLDINGNPIMPKVKGADYKPLVGALHQLNKKLAWILPVVKNKKKVYDVDEEEAEAVDDIVPLKNDDVTELVELEQFYNNTIPDSENKYDYLLKVIDSQGNPYEAPEGDSTTVFLTEKDVHTNLDVLVDNLEDFKSSVVAKSNLANKRFLMTKYNLGFDKLETVIESGSKPYNKRVIATKGNEIYLKSMVFLPEEVVRHSRVGLPGTSILLSSALNSNKYYYYKRFSKRAILDTQVIESNEGVLQATGEEKFLETATEFILDEGVENEVYRQELYEKYLQAVIPRTKTLFNMVKKYINEKLTLKEVVAELEPFLVYSDDLTYQQYREMTKFINDKVNAYKKEYVARNRDFKELQKGKKFADKTIYSLFEILDLQRKDVLEKGYGLRSRIHTSSENYSRIMAMDGGRLFTTALAFENIMLMTPVDINEIFERQRLQITSNEVAASRARQESMSAPGDSNTCANFVLAKKYLELDELLDDNGKPVYFDKNLDQTRYDIIEEYASERETMLPEDFLPFLTEKLITNIGLSEVSAEKDARAMIDGRRLIEDGEYASLEIDGGEKTYYYKRVGDVWERDESIPNVAMKNKTFCNIQQDCVSTEEECKTESYGQKEMAAKALSSMINEFNIKYEVSKGEMELMIKNRFEYYKYRLRIMKKLQMDQRYKYNDVHMRMGMDAKEEEPVALSPYAELRDAILGQYDIVKKNNDIVKFERLFLRGPTESEDQFWLYCKETNLKLLPVFLHTLASTFVNNQYNYVRVLDEICAKQGKLSDDGDAWVDEHSGYVIKKVSFDTDEGYEASGFKATSRAELLEDLQATRSTEFLEKFSDPRAETISNVVLAMGSYMGISVEPMQEFIIRNTLLITTKILPSQTEYDKKRAIMAKKGKKLPSYEEAFTQTMMFVTLSYLVVGIQVTIPSIRTKKQFPGCKKAFDGFPLNGDDESGMTYVACVANKIKSKVAPWNVLAKLSASGIVKRMKDIINKYVVTDSVVQTQFREKREYLLKETGDEIPIELDIAKWQTFLPPLRPIKTLEIERISDEFKNAMIRDIRSGKGSQHEKLLTLRSNIIHYSMKIIEYIQEEVSKQAPLLKNMAEEPFLENACCIDSEYQTTIGYFMNKIPAIRKCNAIVRELNNINWDIYTISLAPRMYSPIDTRRVFPPLSSQFSETTIYRAIIHYCQFGTTLPIPENLTPVCLSKPEDFSLLDSLKLQIKKLKDDGKNFELEDLQRLLSIVDRENEVHVPLHSDTKTTTDKLREFLNDDEASELIPQELKDVIIPLLDTFDLSVEEDTEEMQAFINFIDEQNNGLKTELISFLQQNSKSARRGKFEELMTYFRDTTWESPERSIEFLKNNIYELTQVFPNMAKNGVTYTLPLSNIKLPRHIEKALSARHVNDIKTIIYNYYNTLIQFSESDTLTPIFATITESTSHWRVLMELLPVYQPIIKSGDKHIHAVITPKMVQMLMEYVLLQCYLVYVKQAQSLEPQRTPMEEELVMTTTEELLNEEIGNISEMDIVSGEMLKRGELVASFINEVVGIFNNTKRQLNYTYDEIIHRVNVSKEKEKDQFTKRLKDLSDEEREIENIMKGHKMGDWAKGLSKGVTQYTRDTYDDEREAMERTMVLEQQVGQKDFVSDMNRDIYMLEAMEEQARADAIDAEESRIDYMGEDADYEEIGMDGDEMY
jgi:hypothetical protein